MAQRKYSKFHILQGLTFIATLELVNISFGYTPQTNEGYFSFECEQLSHLLLSSRSLDNAAQILNDEEESRERKTKEVDIVKIRHLKTQSTSEQRKSFTCLHTETYRLTYHFVSNVSSCVISVRNVRSAGMQGAAFFA